MRSDDLISGEGDSDMARVGFLFLQNSTIQARVGKSFAEVSSRGWLVLSRGGDGRIFATTAIVGTSCKFDGGGYGHGMTGSDLQILC